MRAYYEPYPTLRGLGEAPVPDGSVLVYRGQWPAPAEPSSPSDILAAVASSLRQFGLQVLSSSSDAGAWNTTFLGNAFNVTIQLQVSNGMGFGNPNDVGSIVDHAEYMANGVMPQGSSTSMVSRAGGGVSMPQSPADMGSWLESNAWWLALLAAGVFVVPRILSRVL